MSANPNGLPVTKTFQVQFDSEVRTVTIDTTTCAVGVAAADSVLIGAAGTVKFSRTANSKLTLRGYMKHNANGAQFDMGKVGDEIPAAYVAELVLNREGGSYDSFILQNGSLTSFGFYVAGETTRNRIAKMTSSVAASYPVMSRKCSVVFGCDS